MPTLNNRDREQREHCDSPDQPEQREVPTGPFVPQSLAQPEDAKRGE
jgi:hypothetical protein